MIQAFINKSTLSWLTSNPIPHTNSFIKPITFKKTNHTKTTSSAKIPQIAFNLLAENTNCSSKSPAVKKINMR